VDTHRKGFADGESAGAALLLPGMSLNHTIFPGLEIPVVCPNLHAIDLGEDGITAELRRDGFDCYVRLVEEELRCSNAWNNLRRLVIAHSFGGMLALHWLTTSTRSERARVSGLVLIGTTPGPMYERVRVRIPKPQGGEWRLAVGSLVPLWNLQPTTRFVKRLLSGGKLHGTPVDFSKLDIKNEADMGRAGWRNVDWRALRAFRFTMQGFDVRDRLGEISIPTIVLHGTEDSLFAAEDAQLMADLVPTAELRLIDGADHALPLTHSNEVVRAVRDLLAS
jgi:pimeloyl-ACP methyl ester carboxylesterase